MRRLILLLSVMLLSNISYCQVNSMQFCIGKFYSEVQQMSPKTPTLYRGRKALYQTIDTNNSVVFYVFVNDICVEYNSFIKNKNMDSVEKSIREYFMYNTNLNATIKRIDSNFFNLIIRND